MVQELKTGIQCESFKKKFIFALCGVKPKSRYNSSAAKEWQADFDYLVKRGITGFAEPQKVFSVQEHDPGIECSGDADPGKIGNEKHSSRF